jgi:hypothetical protein
MRPARGFPSGQPANRHAGRSIGRSIGKSSFFRSWFVCTQSFTAKHAYLRAPRRAERNVVDMITWLKLRWARFFTLAGWSWKLSTRPGFDFEVWFSCQHSECSRGHRLLVRVCNHPRDVLEDKHGAFEYPYEEPNPALFGDGPANTYWVMGHGHGCGEEQVGNRWTPQDADWLWERAAHD